jgi:HEAT repeat protein
VKLASKDKRVVGKLIGALKDRDENVRRMAAEALGKIG